MSVTALFCYLCVHPVLQTGGTCPTPVELCEGQSCPDDMRCVLSGPTAPSVCQCQPERLDECAGMISLFSLAGPLCSAFLNWTVKSI